MLGTRVPDEGSPSQQPPQAKGMMKDMMKKGLMAPAGVLSLLVLIPLAAASSCQRGASAEIAATTERGPGHLCSLFLRV